MGGQPLRVYPTGFAESGPRARSSKEVLLSFLVGRCGVGKVLLVPVAQGRERLVRLGSCLVLGFLIGGCRGGGREGREGGKRREREETEVREERGGGEKSEERKEQEEQRVRSAGVGKTGKRHERHRSETQGRDQGKGRARKDTRKTFHTERERDDT